MINYINNKLLFFGLIALPFTSCSQNSEKIETNTTLPQVEKKYVLRDYYSTDQNLDKKVEKIFTDLDQKAIISQLIMPAIGKHGQPEATIKSLVDDGLIGGVLMLNGTTEEYKGWITNFNNTNKEKNFLPFLYSADAEPSLVNRKVVGTRPVKKANEMKTRKEVEAAALSISEDLKAIGINYNFSPVVDMAPNKTVGWRSFGHFPDSVISWSNAFIETSQANNVIATAKHFPGHGFVVGDTHEKLVFIDGEMKEVKNYPDLIENGVLSIMIAHIAVKNNEKYNTDGFPATTSKAIVTDLLRNELGFKGIIVTDALNMGGVRTVKNANSLAIEAGCDILLMPLDARKAHEELSNKYMNDSNFKNAVDLAAKRIIRAKICLGLI